MEEALAFAGTFSVSSSTPASRKKQARESLGADLAGLPTLGSQPSAAKAVRSGAKCPPPVENGEKIVRGTFTPLAMHGAADASDASERRLLGIFTPAEAVEGDAEEGSGVFPLGLSARKGDKGNGAAPLPASSTASKDVKELTLFEVMSANKHSQRGAEVAGYLASVADPSAIDAVEEAASSCGRPTPGGMSSSYSRTPGGSKTPGSSSAAEKVLLLSAGKGPTEVVLHRECTGEELAAVLTAASAGTPLGLAAAAATALPPSSKKAPRTRNTPAAAKSAAKSAVEPAESQSSASRRVSSGSASDPLALADAVTLSEDLQEMLEPGSVRKASPAEEKEEKAAPGAEDEDEDEAPAAEVVSEADALATAAPAWSEEEIGEMKIAELREALGFLELDTTGKKAVLAERLLAALYPKSAPAEAAEEEEVPAVEEPEPPKARGRGNKRASIDEAEPPAAVARPKRAKTAETAPVAAVEEEAPKRRPKRELAAEPAAAPQRASRSRR
jgi:hypothetical protein